MNKQEKKFKRKCIICSEYKEKPALLRFTLNTKTKELILNRNNDINGRSFYICNNKDCLEKALKGRALSKYTKLNTVQNITETIAEILNSENN